MSRPSISRSSSLSSTSSITTADTAPTAKSTSKRTRKRFSHEQLIVLEQAFHRTSHPTREEREAVASQTGMQVPLISFLARCVLMTRNLSRDVKSVTIWFQNKRQTERKVALSNATNRSVPLPLALYPVQYSSSIPNNFDRRSSLPSNLPHTLALAKPTKCRVPSRTASGFLSLDHIASRAELPARSPRTPKKLTRHASYAGTGVQSDTPTAVWETMLSSPLQPDVDASSEAARDSPSVREYLDFTSKRHGKSRPRGRRTLEWACAAARMMPDKDDEDSLDKTQPPLLAPTFDTDSLTTISDDRTEYVDTEVESVGDSQEAITPDTSQSMFSLSPAPARAFRVTRRSKSEIGGKTTEDALKDMHLEDADIIDAAWVLYGLSGRRG